MMTSKKKRKSDISVASLLSIDDGETCIFCLRKDNNEEDYGKFIKKCGLQVHYFCMLFASGLCQRGKTEDVGIYGFLPDDIMKEIKRGSRLRCYCCKKKGSTIGCVVGSCSKKFHLGCGRQNGTLHQFFGSFRSFCQEHRPRQMVPISDRLAFYGTANALCAICMNLVEARASNDTLRAPCCRNSWFHRNCIQKHASTAGLYFFKCPLCNNKEQFQNEMLEFGIYIPDQDAAWETEPNAYNELLERYLHCDALICRCPNGRKYNRDGGKWEILTCDWCGSAGTHEACHSLIKVGRNLVCLECKEIDDKSRKSNNLGKRKKTPVKKKSKVILERKEDVDLEQKGKSEYPGPSSALVKTSITQANSLSQLCCPSRLSPGMVLRLSYQETDDEVDVVEDDEVSVKRRHFRNIPAALGSCEKLSKQRGRSRQRQRSRSSSSEYIPLSSVRQRLRSASRGARNSSPESFINSSQRTARSKHKRSRSSSSESPIRKRLRSASRGRQRERSPIVRRSTSPVKHGEHSQKRRSTARSPKNFSLETSRSLSPDSQQVLSHKRSASKSRNCVTSPATNSSNKSPLMKKSLAYDEVDGCMSSNREKRRKSKSESHPFSSHGYKVKKKRRSSKKMLISMEAELSDLPPEAQHDIHIMTDCNPFKAEKRTIEETNSQDNGQSELTINSQENLKVRKKSLSPIKGCNKSPKSEKTKRPYKKKNKVDSKQMLINKWLTSGKSDNKENYQTKFLTIKWQGMKYIKMLVSPQNNCSDSGQTMCTDQLSSPKALQTEYKSSPVHLRQCQATRSSPSPRVAKLRQSPVTRSRSPQQSPLTTIHTPITAEEILEKLSEKKISVVKPYPLRNSPKNENGKARCSLSSKFIDGSLMENGFPAVTILEKQVTYSAKEKLGGHGPEDSDTLDYMDDDFLTSDDSEGKDASDVEHAYVIKSYKNISGLNQVQVVMPSGL